MSTPLCTVCDQLKQDVFIFPVDVNENTEYKEKLFAVCKKCMGKLIMNLIGKSPPKNFI